MPTGEAYIVYKDIDLDITLQMDYFTYVITMDNS